MQAVKKCLRCQNMWSLLKPKTHLRPLCCVRPLATILNGGASDLVKSATWSLGPTVELSYSTTAALSESIDAAAFEKACEETLESLTEYFERVVEGSDDLLTADVSYSSGVLNVNLGARFGVYVINRQSPNRQIWLSSPISGPKRYDFVPGVNAWVYKHDGQTLHRLLQDEISKFVKDVDFSQCSYSKM